MTDELKPTNEEIAEYIFDWIEQLDGAGIVLVNDEDVKLKLSFSDFEYLRSIFEDIV